MNRQDITNRIINAMESGICPWKRPWTNIAHQNHFSGRKYRGINQILLSLDLDVAPHWGTFRQWKESGCPVRKGETATPVIFFTVIEAKEDDDDDKNGRKFPLMRHYSLFHAGQVNDPNGKFKHLLESKMETDYEIAQQIIEHCDADIRIGGNRAFYVSEENYIRIPRSGQFENEEERLATIFHELGHWGDKNFLGTELSTDKSTSEYAYAELVAELTACFLCQACAVQNSFENHESYIASWIQAMKNDTSYIWRASGDASKIADHLLQKAGIVQEEEPAFTE